MSKRVHSLVAAWVLGSLLLLFMIGVFIWAPDELSQYKLRIVAILSSLLGGFWAAFLTGTMSMRGSLPFFRKIAFQASGGVAVFVLLLLFWYSPMAPIKLQARAAMTEIFSDHEIHLGDNIYPENWGYYSNPLNQTIYKQGIPGLVYFDKDNGSFHPDESGATHVGQRLVTRTNNLIQGIDFSAHRTVRAFQGEGSVPEVLKAYVERNENHRFIRLGRSPTVLFYDESQPGDFYERYAAIGWASAFSVEPDLLKAGIELSQNDIKECTLLIECYHGGRRPGQKQNFVVRINDWEQHVNARSENLREKEVVRINVPIQNLRLDEMNEFMVFVLPWIEERPRRDSASPGPAHFRDVVISRIQLVVEGAD